MQDFEDRSNAFTSCSVVVFVCMYQISLRVVRCHFFTDIILQITYCFRNL